MHLKVFKLLKIVHKQYKSKSEVSSEDIPSKKALTFENNADQVTFDYVSIGRGSSSLDTKRPLKRSRSSEQFDQWLDSLECDQALRNLGIKRSKK